MEMKLRYYTEHTKTTFYRYQRQKIKNKSKTNIANPKPAYAENIIFHHYLKTVGVYSF